MVFYKNCFLFFVIIATEARKTTNFILFMSRNTCALRRHLRHRNRVRCHRVLLFPVHLRYSTAETRRTSLISQIPLSPPSPSYPVWNPPRCAYTNAKCGVLVAGACWGLQTGYGVGKTPLPRPSPLVEIINARLIRGGRSR